MKKLFAAVLALVLLFSLPSVCANAQQAESAALHLEDLADMDADTTFTLRQLLALLREAYGLGYAHGKRGSTPLFPADSSDSGEDAAAVFRIAAAASQSEPTVSYVLNKNTKKFHYPDCSSVDTIEPENREDFPGSRDEALALGYVPCKRCKP